MDYLVTLTCLLLPCPSSPKYYSSHESLSLTTNSLVAWSLGAGIVILHPKCNKEIGRGTAGSEGHGGQWAVKDTEKTNGHIEVTLP